jgi:uncharacterized protein YbjT (DUF2867 family)
MVTDPPTSDPRPSTGRVLVLGATGYVGGRLVPELLAHDHVVRCLSRSKPKGLPWADDAEFVRGDLTDPDSLDEAFDDVDTLVYLVHSLDESDFETTEIESAANVRRAAERHGVRHIVYLSGLGRDDDELSAHLQSRHDVGRELASGGVAVTELRAAVILGAGSASFEMLRSLTEVLPFMVAPRWVTTTLVQPISIGDALHYLRRAIDVGPDQHHDQDGDRHRIVEIGGPDQLTYRDMIALYAEVAGLPKRRILPVPFVTPKLSTHWVNVVSPLPRQLAASLIDSLRNDVVVTDDSARRLSDHTPVTARTAIETAMSAIQDLEIPTRWSGLTTEQRAGRPRPWDPDWAGGTVYEYVTDIDVDASPTDVMHTVHGLGGERGWYGFAFLWAVRGLLDKIVGGVGLRRGRRHPDQIAVGEALDFWRVDAIEPDLFRLRAEMKVPGEAWLEWRTCGADDHGDADDHGGADDAGSGVARTRIEQRARYVPKGLFGRLYWWPLWPVHAVLFPVMLRRIGRAAEERARTTTTGLPSSAGHPSDTDPQPTREVTAS